MANTGGSSLRVERLNPSRRADFFRVHCDANDAGWCRCVAWWLPTWQGWGDRTAEENRQVRDQLFRDGHDDGYLLYRDRNPIGWCQVGPRDRLEKLTRQFELTPAPDTWAVTCFFLAPTERRKGLARFLLESVLDDLRRRSVRRIEAFPKRGENLASNDLWNGPEAIFRAAGFDVVRDDPQRPVYARDL